jgi:hypothetical protein
MSPYRTDIIRITSDYEDLSKALFSTFNTYQTLERKIAPYVAKNVNAGFPPGISREWIKENVSTGAGMHPVMYIRMCECIETFFRESKGMKRLPYPHIVSHRSVHYGEGLFSIKPVLDIEPYLERTKSRVRKYAVNTVHEVEIDGLDTLYIENLRGTGFKYLMLRPKLGKTGMPSVKNWEALLLKNNPGYLIDHIDTDKNPRYNGT